MEQYWELTSMITSELGLAGIGYLLYRFVRPYGDSSRPAAAAGITYGAVMGCLYLIPWEIPGMLAYGAGTAAAFAVLCMAERTRWRQKLFLGLVMYLLDWIAHGIIVQLRDILFILIVDTSYMTADPTRHFLAYTAVEVFCVFMRLLAAAGLIWFLNRRDNGRNMDMDRRELALMLVTPLLVLVGYGTFAVVARIYERDLGQYIWNTSPQFSWIKLCYQLLSYLAMATALAFYQSIKSSHKKEKEAALLAGQLADMKRHIDEVEGLYREIRGLKHDMGNHLMLVEQLVHRGCQEEAAEYLKDWKEQLNQALPEIKTGNPVTDVVLAEKQRKAGELGIALACAFAYPQGTRINAFDVSILLSNALDNAFEGAGRARDNVPGPPVVRLRSWRRKNAYLIEVRNPFWGALAPEGENGLPQSTKEGREHGFGLANIQRVAQSYYGDLEIRVEEGQFVLTVLLMVE